MPKEGTYIVIQSFMVNDLGLKGNELLIYAIIYGFSQDGSSEFSGSLQYLADWTNSSKQCVIDTLKKLLEKKLIMKNVINVNNVRLCTYKTSVQNFDGYSKNLDGVVKNFEWGSKKSLTGYSKNLNGGSQNSLPNNIYDNTNDNTTNIIEREGEQAPTHPKARFLKPTLEEIREYCLSRNNYVDPERFFDYYEANGWKVGKNPMKDWRAAVRTWESREKSEAPKKTKKQEYSDEEYEAMCDDLENTPY